VGSNRSTGFFRGLPAQPGVVIVIVQHLSPNHESLMEELLQRFTALAVHRAEDGLEVEANHVYVLPPEKRSRSRGATCVSPIVRGARLVVSDRPLLHLAGRGMRAAGGGGGAVRGGTDGSRGVRSIHEAAVWCWWKTRPAPRSKACRARPSRRGITDAVLSPEEIARALLDHASSGDLPDGDTAPLVDQIIELLRQHRGIELADYKPGTIYRRMMRRVDAQRIDSLARYLEILQRDRRELEALHDDLFIGSPPSSATRRSLPRWENRWRRWRRARSSRSAPAHLGGGLCLRRRGLFVRDPVRRGAVGVFTSPRVQDLRHRRASQGARQRHYRHLWPRAAEERVARAPGRFFSPTSDGGFKVADTSVTPWCLPPTTSWPTPRSPISTSCRAGNLLIYFRPKAQRQALASLAYGLRIGGCSCSGRASIRRSSRQYFEPVNEMSRIYRKRAQAPIMRRTELATRALLPPRDDWRRREHTLLPPTMPCSTSSCRQGSWSPGSGGWWIPIRERTRCCTSPGGARRSTSSSSSRRGPHAGHVGAGAGAASGRPLGVSRHQLAAARWQPPRLSDVGRAAAGAHRRTAVSADAHRSGATGGYR
jgi:two-component system CheB/CheR fusion protein